MKWGHIALINIYLPQHVVLVGVLCGRKGLIQSSTPRKQSPIAEESPDRNSRQELASSSVVESKA